MVFSFGGGGRSAAAPGGGAMNVSGEDELKTWFRKVRSGSPACAFCSDVEDARNAIERLATSEREPTRAVALTWDEVPPLGNELGLLVAALAKATLESFPSLYGQTQELRDDWLQTEVETEAHEITRSVPGVRGQVCRSILLACYRNEVPRLGQLPKAEAIRQYSLALEPRRLVVVICVRSSPDGTKRLRSLAQGAEWLAANTKARVVLVLPRSLYGKAELDHVGYTAHVFADGPNPGRTSPEFLPERYSGEPKKSEPTIRTTSPVGQPASQTERLLYDRLTSDVDLAPLFAYNQTVTTSCGESYRVDVIWDEGKLVIEIDGGEHRGQVVFSEDRMRDYNLFISGYSVVRFTNSRVIEQRDEVVQMIRAAVAVIRARQITAGVTRSATMSGARANTA